MLFGVCSRGLGRQLWESIGPYLVSLGFEVQVSGGICFFCRLIPTWPLLGFYFFFLYLLSDRERDGVLDQGFLGGGGCV